MENLFQKLLTTMVIYGIFIMAVGKAAMHRSYLYPHNPYFGALSQERARFFALPRKNGAREARERCAASRRQPVPRQPLRGAYEARERYAVSGRGISRSAERGRTALPRGAKRIDNLRFSILLGLQLSLWQPRERALRPYFVSNSHKGTVSVHVSRIVAA